MYAFVSHMCRSQRDEVLVFALRNCGGGVEGVQGTAVSFSS